MRDTAFRRVIRVLLYVLVVPAQIGFLALCLHLASPASSLGI